MTTSVNDNDRKEQQRTTNNRDNAMFIGNAQQESAKTKSNLLQIPSITLPKGGGAMKSIDDKFSVNAANGTAAYSIPLPLSPGRGSSAPALSLNYNSGSGNGIFGIGWSVDVPSIQRKAERKLPLYQDSISSDTFMFTGVEDLVPIDNISLQTNGITRYRPRIEGSFLRIEKIEQNGNIYWQVRTKENVVSVFGKSDEAKLFSPVEGEENKVFKWCLEYTYDDKGNFTKYTYKKENKENVIASLTEKNRLNGIAPFTNSYLKSVQYGNRAAYYEGDELPIGFLFELVFDYGEHDINNPNTNPAVINGNEQFWITRSDAFSDYRPGFEVRTYRLCQRILMFHHFEELSVGDYLVRSLDFVYDEQPHLTYLQSAVQTGYIWNEDGSLRSKKSLPPLEFTYIKPGFSKEVKEVSPDDMIHAPIGINNPYQWTDLYSEGIAGIFTEQANGWYYKENEGNGHFSSAMLVSPKPSFTGIRDGSWTLQDLEANGKKYLVSNASSLKGYFELTTEEEWISFYPFNQYPNIDFSDPNVKFIDLNGDGKADLIISREQDFIWYEAKGKMGYDDHNIAAKAMDEEKGPAIVFAGKDEKLLIAIADMSGDGLADIVLVTYNTVSYYPNLGYGRFGARVSMEMTGAFDDVTSFNTRYLNFTDIDGSGTTDIVYTGNNKIEVWFNQSGNSLSEPSSFFNPFPQIDDHSNLSFIDLLGNGTSCMVWSSSLPQYANAPMRYIDMMEGRKPHVMVAHKNNSGKEVTLEYVSSTQYYLADKKSGKPWITKLPFPVQCVSKVIVEDKVSQTRFTNEYTYHHGYYDTIEREFRGFAMVEQRDTETYEHFVKEIIGAGAVNTTEKDLFQPAVITKSWFHTGAYRNRNVLFHALQNEYYPNAASLTDADLIHTLQTYILPETLVDNTLSADELAEYCRALKGLPLRQEIYSDEGDAETKMHPYSISQSSYSIRCLQHKEENAHAVFLTHEKEKLTISFERNPADPRIAHNITIETDDYGNVLQSAAVVYGRKKDDNTLPADGDRNRQRQSFITYTTSFFTSLIDTESAYRLPVSYDTQSWELSPFLPSSVFFTAEELQDTFQAAIIKNYEEDASVHEKRKIEHARTLFLKNDLSGAMPFGTMDTLSLPYQNYQLAFTPSLLTSIYSSRTDETMLRNEAKYASPDNDGNYWIASGRDHFHPDLSADSFAKSVVPPTPADVLFAKKNFYLPVAYEDNFGLLSKVFYDPHRLMIVRSIDAADNETLVKNINYRTLQPYLLQDANDNRSGVRFDELGLVTHTFIMAKEDEFKGDFLDINSLELSAADEPTSFLEYQFRYFDSGGALPNRTKMSAREKHHFKETEDNHEEIETDFRWQESYSYSDGSGHEVQKKIQAESGDAPLRDNDGNLVIDANGNLQFANTAPALRWIGNGRTVYNNKGKPVKQYEPYFDSTPEYNMESELTELGFSSVMYYDALGRAVKTVHANGSFSRVEFDAWMQKQYNENDTVLDDECAWYKNRINGQLGEAEQTASQQTGLHNDTPAITYLDSLARPFLSVAHNKIQRSGEAVLEAFYYTRTYLDIEGNARRLTQVKSNVEKEVMSWQYDMLGNICYQHSADAGDRWMLTDVMGKSLRLWDSRDHVFSYRYDSLHRPLLLLVNDGVNETAFEKYIYGDSLADMTTTKSKNLRGRLYRHSDTAGVVTHTSFDYKGILLRSERQLTTDYKMIPDWNANPVLEAEIFAGETKYDALNRPVQVTSPDNSLIFPVYNEANMLNSVGVQIKGSDTLTQFVTNIDYNAKGQREAIAYNNGTRTFYTYEADTYRLARLMTVKSDDNTVLQDLNYTYDPVGNITRQFDNAQKTIFYGGQKVAAQSGYLYDAIYQLVEAEGREHTGQIAINAADNWNDDWCRLQVQPNAPVQLRNYTQKYEYDEAANIISMRHIAGAGSWTRAYQYSEINNQLLRTIAGNNVPVSQSFDYTYNAHGSIETMPHFTQNIDWTFREEMQHIHLGGGGEAWYVYDATGQRIRKVIEKAQQREERIYFGGFEVFRVFDNANNKTLERETLHVMDDKQRIGMIETRTAGDDGSPEQLIRYQYSNHLGTACLELDEFARIISYEEYHPYGTTAYQATDASRQVPAKRYRYTGMERDEESGFSYHSARYYMPWLGKWLSADPIGIGGGMNVYAYCNGNPLNKIDITGTEWCWNPFASDCEIDTPRILGGVKMVGGALETAAGATLTAAGAATSEFGIGIPIAAAGVFVTAHGVDTTVSGARTVWNGEPVDSGTSHLLQYAGMSRRAANLTDAGISVVGTLGAGALTRAPGVVAAASPTSGLVHMTTAESAAAIEASGTLGKGASTLYAATPSLAEASTPALVARTGLLPSQATTAVEISADAAANAFRSPAVVGPITAWQRASGAFYSAGAGSVNLTTGVFTRTGPAINQLFFYGTDTVITTTIDIAQPLISQPTEASSGVSNVTVNSSSIPQRRASASSTSSASGTSGFSAGAGLPNPANYSTYDQFQAAVSGAPYTEDYIMQQWASVHGWQSQ